MSSITMPTFHEGERALQELAGVNERMEEIGPRVIRNFMPEQHREFFAQLPFVIAGSVDVHGQPWASILARPAGFVATTDPTHLTINALPLASDPLHENLYAGAPIGLLGIEPHTRRRNRANGVVESLTTAGFTVNVLESFGNCPKYIQARKPEYIADQVVSASSVSVSNALDAAARALIADADTFFIATAYPSDEKEAGARYGVDVSHRGGKPGFVRLADEGTLLVPELSGNYFFNTLGNIAVNPRAGLLFIDFKSGDLLYLAVDASIIWNGPQVDAYAGAERLLRFTIREVRRVEAGLPLRWGEAELSPMLGHTGAWPK